MTQQKAWNRDGLRPLRRKGREEKQVNILLLMLGIKNFSDLAVLRALRALAVQLF
jgi:hypothetical protein